MYVIEVNDLRIIYYVGIIATYIHIRSMNVPRTDLSIVVFRLSGLCMEYDNVFCCCVYLITFIAASAFAAIVAVENRLFEMGKNKHTHTHMV